MRLCWRFRAVVIRNQASSRLGSEMSEVLVNIRTSRLAANLRFYPTSQGEEKRDEKLSWRKDAAARQNTFVPIYDGRYSA